MERDRLQHSGIAESDTGFSLDEINSLVAHIETVFFAETQHAGRRKVQPFAVYTSWVNQIQIIDGGLYEAFVIS